MWVSHASYVSYMESCYDDDSYFPICNFSVRRDGKACKFCKLLLLPHL